ncbi:unnamed protein product [Nippostrongylus brasiliensis]|uniref:Secreted protein n=1 Tax=Nippostrongylus brasiliensis TaxID=27835 RepID=A0A0N4XTC2_NIPBR|nr:unnamed protein product [Nippostrongylus brasiliensis]
MQTFLVMTLTVAVMVLGDDGPVYVDELEDLVTSAADRTELKLLEKNRTMIRSEKQQRLNVILARQPASVQMEKARDANKQQWLQMKTQQIGGGPIDYAARLNAIDNDMSISDDQAKQQKQMLKQQLVNNATMTTMGGQN